MENKAIINKGMNACLFVRNYSEMEFIAMKSEHSQKNYQDIKTYQLLILPYKCFGLTVKFSAVRW